MTKQEREAWAVAYRVYDEFAPGLRQAAVLDDGGELARGLFSAIGAKLAAAYDATDENGRLLTVAAYGILESVYESAHRRDKTAQERAERKAWATMPQEAEPRQSA